MSGQGFGGGSCREGSPLGHSMCSVYRTAVLTLNLAEHLEVLGVKGQVPSNEEPEVLPGYVHAQNKLQFLFWFISHGENLNQHNVIQACSP